MEKKYFLIRLNISLKQRYVPIFFCKELNIIWTNSYFAQTFRVTSLSRVVITVGKLMFTSYFGRTKRDMRKKMTKYIADQYWIVYKSWFLVLTIFFNFKGMWCLLVLLIPSSYHVETLSGFWRYGVEQVQNANPCWLIQPLTNAIRVRVLNNSGTL